MFGIFGELSGNTIPHYARTLRTVIAKSVLNLEIVGVRRYVDCCGVDGEKFCQKNVLLKLLKFVASQTIYARFVRSHVFICLESVMCLLHWQMECSMIKFMSMFFLFECAARAIRGNLLRLITV